MSIPSARRAVHTCRSAGAVVLAALGTLAGAVALPAEPAHAVAGCDAYGLTLSSLNPPVFYTDLGASPAMTSGYAGYVVSSTSARPDLWVQLSGFTGGALALAANQPASLPLGAVVAGGSKPAYFLLTAAANSVSAQSHAVGVWEGRPGTPGATQLCGTTGSFGSVQDVIQASANKVQDVTGDGQAVTVSTSAPQLGGTVTVSVEGNTGTIGSGPAGDPNGVYMTPTALSSWPAAAFRLTGTSLRISPDGTSPDQTFTNLLRKAPLGSSSRDYVATYTFTVTGTTSTATSLYPIQDIASGTQIKHTNVSNFATTVAPIPAASNPLTVAVTASPTTLPANGGTVHVTQTLASAASTVSTVDELDASLPPGTTYVGGSARLNGVAVADPGVSGMALTFPGPFTTRSGGSAVLTYDVDVAGTAGRYAFSGSGLLAGTVIDTTASTSDATPDQVVVTVPADKTAQSITFPALADSVLGDPAPELAAVASSGLSVTYSTLTPLVCSVSEAAVTLLTPGTCTVRADQAGDATYAGAPAVTRSFQVEPPVVVPSVTPTPSETPTPTETPSVTPTPSVTSAPTPTPSVPSPVAQLITFPALADTELGSAPPALPATASSGLPVTYSVATPEVCSVDEGVLTLEAVGTCTVLADQAGDSAFAPAPQELRSFAVTLPPPAVPQPPTPPTPPAPLPLAQGITFPSLPGVRLDQAPPALDATAGSGLPVTYASLTPSVCTVRAGVLALHAVGRCDVQALQGGNAAWAPATPVTASFQVGLPAITSSGGGTATTGTRPGVVTLGNVPAGAIVTAPAHPRTIRGLARVQVTGTRVTVVATDSFSGVLRIPLTVTGGGATTTVTVTVTVSPDAVLSATSSPASAASTRLSWPPSRNATAYRVERAGRVLCRTTSTTCTVAGLFGPRSGLTVVALGGAGTTSAPTGTRSMSRSLVLVAGVHFGIDSAVLDASARRILDRAAITVRRQGFTRLVLVAHTDSQASHRHNVLLSERRAQVTEAYLRRRLRGSGTVLSASYRAESDPVASNRTTGGRAENRRTDVWVG